MEYICTIPEIAEFIGIAARVIREKAANYNWQPTGERVQGGGDKYNIDTIRLYKSDEKHQAAIMAIKTACNMKRDQAQLAAAAALKTKLEADTLTTIQSEVAKCKRFLPEELLAREAELRAKREALENAEGMNKDEKPLVMLALTKEKGKKAGVAKKWCLDQCQAWMIANGFKSKHTEKNPDGWNEKGIKALCEAFIAGQIDVPEEYRNILSRKGKLSLTIPSIRTWKKDYEAYGLYGVARKHKEPRGEARIPPHQQELIYSLLYDFPHVKAARIREALQSRFPGEYIVHEDTIVNFVKYWKETNKASVLQITAPDSYRNKYQFAVGKADANITRLNQVWEAEA